MLPTRSQGTPGMQKSPGSWGSQQGHPREGARRASAGGGRGAQGCAERRQRWKQKGGGRRGGLGQAHRAGW
eukprot:10365144-Alexandrium_andersonii.AAC.1